MALSNTLSDNPYVTINNDTVDICYRKNNCHLPVEKIKKMYLKRKTGYWSGIYDSLPLLFVPEKSYRLHISTDENEISFTVKSFERQYFIGLISWVRSLRNSN